MDTDRVFKLCFAGVNPHDAATAETKERMKAEVDEVNCQRQQVPA